MTGTGDASPAALAELIPDEPQWIDLRGVLLTGRCDVWVGEGKDFGLIAGSWDYPFAALYGTLDPVRIAEATAVFRSANKGRNPDDEWQLLASREARPLVSTALPGWRRRGVVLHRWKGFAGSAEPADGYEIRVLPDGHRAANLPLDHLPESSRRELDSDWVSRQPMAVAMADVGPVSFCYAAFTTERLWDVAIETLSSHRRRGLAATCFLALAEHLAKRDKVPTWGAMENNPASLGLAAKLGFVRDASLDGWTPAIEGRAPVSTPLA